MAKEYITRCDADITAKIKDCGEQHEDTRTFTIKVDDEAWEVDLGGPHAEVLLQIIAKGRPVENGFRRPQDHRNLERRIRNTEATG